MSLKLKRKKRTTVPPLAGGTYLAICIGIVDIGEQYNQTFKNYNDKLMLLFEISGETVNVDGEDKPRWLSREYTASLNEKAALYKHLVAWRSRDFTENELDTDGDGFDIESMLGKPCMLTVIEKDGDNGTYNRIENIAALPKGVPAPTTEQELLAYDIDERDEEVFAKLPEWIQDKIKKSTQFAENPPEDDLEKKTSEGDENEPETEEECPI